MFENIKNIFKKNKKRELLKSNSKDKAKERLHLVLMQDRANVSADFLDLMRREIIEVIKKYIDIDEEAMDVRLTTETNEDGVQTAPALYANIPIINIKDETRKLSKTNQDTKISIEPPKTKENEIKKNDTKEEVKKENQDTNTIQVQSQEQNKDTITENNDKPKEENTTNQVEQPKKPEEEKKDEE